MAAGVNILIRADSSGYQSAVKAAKLETQKLASEYNVASSKAKLLGSASDQLKAKKQSLTAQIKTQSEITALHSDRQKQLTETLAAQKSKHSELAAQIDKAKKAYNEQAEAAGKDSTEAKALKEELNKLEKQQGELTREISKTEDQLTKATTATNNSEAAANSLNKELKETAEALKTAKFDEFTEKMDKIGNKAIDVGKKLTTYITVPLAAMVVGAGKAAIDFESAFAGVMKTNDEVVDSNGNVVYSYEDLRQGIIDMSNEIPASTTAISSVAEAAGQLGIATEDVLDFSRIMIDLGNTTNLSCDDAATAIAKFINITGTSSDEASNLGSTLVALGNNYATTEADIMNMATRLAAAGTQIGMSDADILGLSATLASLGLEAQAGGSAFSKVIKEMALDVETGKGNIENFAEVAGMSVSDFSALFQKDATAALEAFIVGLGDTENMGMSTIAMLDEMELTELRLSDALLRTSGSSDLLSRAVADSNTAWSENTALTNEANIRYGTTESKLEMTKSKLMNLAIALGDKLLPPFNNLLEAIGNAIEWFGNLDSSTQNTILIIAGIAAAVGPVITIVGKLATILPMLLHPVQALNVAFAANPIGVVVIAVAALVAGFVALYNNCEGFRNFIDAAFGKIKEVVGGVVDGFKNAVETVKNFFGGVKETISGIMTAAKDTVSEKLGNIKTAYEENGGGIQGVVAGAWEGIKGFYTTGLTFVDNLTGGKLTEIKDKFTTKMEEVKNGVSERLESVKTAFSEKLQSAWDTAKNTFSGVAETASSLMQQAKDNVQEKLNNIKTAYDENGGGLKGIAAATMEGVKGYFSTGYDALNNLTGGRLGDIVTSFREKLNSAKQTVSDIMDGIKKAFSDKIEAAKKVVGEVIEKIKGFFKFEWSLPSLKMPHLTITGKLSINPPSVPKFGIEWYKTGGIMTNPTVFGASGNKLLAGGEAGAEAILPLAPFYKQLAAMLDARLEQLENGPITVYVTTLLDGEEIAAKTEKKVSAGMAKDYRGRR